MLQAKTTIQKAEWKQQTGAKHILGVLMYPVFNFSRVFSEPYQNVSHLTSFVMSLYSANCIVNSNKKEENGNMVYQERMGSAKTCLSIGCLFTLKLSLKWALIVDF